MIKMVIIITNNCFKRTHEPICLEDWKIENNKLPAELRRQIPQKPDISSLSYPHFSLIKMSITSS